MASPGIVIDGSQKYGTPLVTINGTVYQLNNIDVDRPVTEAMDRDANGRPQRQRWTADIAGFTAEAQYASNTTPLPVFGQTFTITVDSPGYGSELFVVMPQKFVADNGEGNIRVIPIVAKKVLNGSVTLVQ